MKNSLFNVPFKAKSEFMELPRGTSRVLMQGEKVLVRWKDNNIAAVATNKEKNNTKTLPLGMTTTMH